MDADHINLLFYTQVRWLSRGNVVLRAFELREELKQFSGTQHKNEWVAMLMSSDWLAKLCYLSDIFERINVLNRTLQGKDTNLMLFHNKIHGFLSTLALLKNKASQNRFVLFPHLCSPGRIRRRSSWASFWRNHWTSPVTDRLIRTLLPWARCPIIHRDSGSIHCTIWRHCWRRFHSRGDRKIAAGFRSEIIVQVSIFVQLLV